MKKSRKTQDVLQIDGIAAISTEDWRVYIELIVPHPVDEESLQHLDGQHLKVHLQIMPYVGSENHSTNGTTILQDKLQ